LEFDAAAFGSVPPKTSPKKDVDLSAFEKSSQAAEILEFVGIVGIYVPISAIFSETEPTFSSFRSLLGRLSRTDVLFWCARLNSIVSGQSGLNHEQRQAFCVQQFLSRAEIGLLDRFCSKQNRPAEDVTVFFRGQILELLRWAALYCDDRHGDGTTFEDPEVRRTFAQACCLASDFWSRRVYGEALDPADGLDAARRRALGPFRKGMEGSLVPGELSQSLGRGWQLFREYVPREERDFESAFESATHLSTEDYFICWTALITNYAKPGTETTIFNADSMAQPTACPDLFERFLALESQSADDLRSSLWPSVSREAASLSESYPFDYRPLRERPILKTADGRLILMDPVFSYEKCSVGPLFHALSLFNANHLFEVFGKAFERYVCDSLARAFPKVKPALVALMSTTIEDRDRNGEQYEIDACINYVTDLVLFEIKAVWGQESKLSPQSSDALLRVLRERYSVTDTSVKGVGQLARAINALVIRQWLGPRNEFEAVRTIFPVIVVHDRLSASPGFGTFIVDEFRKTLLPHVEGWRGELTIGDIRIFAPIVLTVGDVELLEVSIERSGFRETLVDYCRWSPDRMLPFSNFLAEISGQGRVLANRALAATSIEVLTRAIKRLFPQSADNDVQRWPPGFELQQNFRYRR
jgi:hypothetical protein